MSTIDSLTQLLFLVGGISLALCVIGLIGEAFERLDPPPR